MSEIVLTKRLRLTYSGEGKFAADAKVRLSEKQGLDSFERMALHLHKQ